MVAPEPPCRYWFGKAVGWPVRFLGLRDRCLMGKCARFASLFLLTAFTTWARTGSAQEPGTAVPPLLLAVDSLRVDTVDSLLASGTDPDTRGPIGATALMLATRAGAEEIVRRLLSAAADPNLADEDGDVALGFYLARAENPATLGRSLLESGADPNRPNQWGRTPLMFAAEAGHAEVVRLLVESGADPRTRDQDGATALHAAATSGGPEVVDGLLALDLSVDEPDGLGATPLFYAAQGNDPETARRLLEAGADVSHPDSSGDVPLIYAASAGSVEIVEVLLAAGADPSRAGASGSTPLLYAAEFGNREVAEALVDGGADPNGADELGRTPLMAAAELGDTLLVRMLADAGADLNQRDLGGLSALDHAEAYRADAAAEFLTVRGATPAPPLTPEEQRIADVAAGTELAAVLPDPDSLPGSVVSAEGSSNQYGAEEEYTRVFEAVSGTFDVGESGAFSLETAAIRFGTTRVARAFIRSADAQGTEALRRGFLRGNLNAVASEDLEGERVDPPALGDRSLLYRFRVRTPTARSDLALLFFTRGPVLVVLGANGPPGRLRDSDLAEVARRIDRRVLAGARLTEADRARLDSMDAARGSAGPARLAPGEAVREGVDLASLILTAPDLSSDATVVGESVGDPPSTTGQVTRLIQGRAGEFLMGGQTVLTVQQSLSMFPGANQATSTFVEAQEGLLSDSVSAELAVSIGLAPSAVEVISIEEMEAGDASVALLATVDSDFITASFALGVILRGRYVTTIMLLSEEGSDALAVLENLGARVDERVQAVGRP